MWQRIRRADRSATDAARARVSALHRRRGWVPRVPEREAATVAEPPDVPRHSRESRHPLVLALFDRVRVRLALEAGHAVVLVLLALLAVGGSLLLLHAARPTVEPVSATRPTVVVTGTPPAGAGRGSPDPAPTALVTVHVAGHVKRPGIVRLTAGARVVDAIEAAGGADAGVDLTALNLARVLSDGEQVLVGVEPPSGAAPAGTGGGGPVQVSLNTATLEQLESLPGVGPVLAQRILDWREANGRFTSIDELREVSGIGPRIFDGLADLVRL